MARRSILRAVAIGALLGGALDLLFAVAFAASRGVAPERVFKTIASGLLGEPAFAGGGFVSALGIASHFVLSLLWAALFMAVAMGSARVARRPILAGITFGTLVFLAMRLVVLPLSAYPRPVSFAPLASTLDLLSHMLLFGVPIALLASRALRARGPAGPPASAGDRPA